MAHAALSVIVIHGIGSQTKADPCATGVASYSGGLSAGLEARIGPERFARRVIWREVYWADIIQNRQTELEARMEKVLCIGPLRRFVLNVPGNAATCQSAGRASSTYPRIHARVAQALADADAARGALVQTHTACSHRAYWTARTILAPRAAMIRECGVEDLGQR